MESVKVKRDELVTIMTENRDRHREIFEEAVEGYRTEAVRLLEEHIDRIKNGSLIRVAVSIPMPEDHTSDYDRVIKMATMSVDDQLELTDLDFTYYVMDNWHWKRQWLTTNSAYSPTAASTLESEA